MALRTWTAREVLGRRTVRRCVASGRRGDLFDDRSAALLVRVWLEGDDGFRARLTTLRGGSEESHAKEVTVAVASSAGDVLDAVRDWLDDFLGDTPNPIDSDG